MNKGVAALVLITSPDVVDGVATCDQHKRSDASVRLVGTTNPQIIEVGLMEFALIVTVFGVASVNEASLHS